MYALQNITAVVARVCHLQHHTIRYGCRSATHTFNANLRPEPQPKPWEERFQIIGKKRCWPALLFPRNGAHVVGCVLAAATSLPYSSADNITAILPYATDEVREQQINGCPVCSPTAVADDTVYRRLHKILPRAGPRFKARLLLDNEDTKIE